MEGGEDDHVYLESLKSLKELSQLQCSFRQVEWRVKRRYGESEACRVMAEDCGQEIKRLEEEKALLTERLATVDRDIHQLADLQQTLTQERQSKVEAVPIHKYDSALRQVNFFRTSVGLEVLSECQASLAAKEMSQSRPKKRPSCGVREKAGPASKCCPHCQQQVPRNAQICSHCHAPCRLKKGRLKSTAAAKSRKAD